MANKFSPSIYDLALQWQYPGQWYGLPNPYAGLDPQTDPSFRYTFGPEGPISSVQLPAYMEPYPPLPPAEGDPREAQEAIDLYQAMGRYPMQLDPSLQSPNIEQPDPATDFQLLQSQIQHANPPPLWTTPPFAGATRPVARGSLAEQAGLATLQQPPEGEPDPGLFGGLFGGR